MIDYVPPFELTNEMLDKVSSIMEKIGKLDKNPYLRNKLELILFIVLWLLKIIN